MNLRKASKARLIKEVRDLRRDGVKLANDAMGLMVDLHNARAEMHSARAIGQEYKKLFEFCNGSQPGTQPPTKKRGEVVRLVPR